MTVKCSIDNQHCISDLIIIWFQVVCFFVRIQHSMQLIDMDIIEEGYNQLTSRIKEYESEIEEKGENVRNDYALLLERMAETARPVVGTIGMNMLKRGKIDNDGELFHTDYYTTRFIALGKTEPMPFRPDDPAKKVDDQICVLDEEGSFFELMYSSDGQTVDSYLNAISPAEIIDLYGLEIMYMLYRALRDHMKGQRDLVDALGRVLDFVREEDEKK